MKKTTKLFLAIGCLTALTIVSQAQPITILNGGFELNTVKTPFWDSTGAPIVGATPDLNAVPDWTPNGNGGPQKAGAGDSGVESTVNYGGSWHAYLDNTDPGIYQTTTYGIVPNEVYSVNLDIAGEWSDPWTADNSIPHIGHVTAVSLYADDGIGDRFIFATTTFNSAENWTMANWTMWGSTPTFSIDDGYHLGVMIQNVTPVPVPPYAGWENSWTVVDNVTMQVDNVPEPSTIALLTLGGLGALVGIRRRRA
jgi:hypothetical protein